MSAVVQTGSSDAKSACGTNVTVFGPSARPTRGAARVAEIAAADFSTFRRFIRSVPCVFSYCARLRCKPASIQGGIPRGSESRIGVATASAGTQGERQVEMYGQP